MIRAVPYTSLWAGTLLWAVISGGLLYATAWQLHENYLFAHFFAPATATVEDRYTTVTHGRHGSTTYYHLHEQMPVSVFYAARDPKKFTVDLTRREV